jgi:hypothetical protein
MPNKLSDLQIDEISLVYKGANQHSRVAIAKSLDGQQEETVEIFDQDGNPVDPDTLELGDIVFDADGEAYQLSDDDDDEDEYDDDRELESVGKGWADALSGGKRVLSSIGANTKGTAQAARGYAKNTVAPAIKGATGAATTHAGTAANAAGGFARRNKGVLLAGGGGTVGGIGLGVGGSAMRNRNVNKSFGDAMRSELSKALSDDDRDEVIAKAFDYVEYLEEVAKSAEQVAEEERYVRRQSEYLEIAKSYNLPVSDEDLAEAMMAAEDALDPEYVEILATCLSAASDVLFNEVGAQGGGTSSFLMDQIEDYANNAVAKSADGSTAAEISKAFEADPSLYDRYLDETGRYNR